MKKSLWCAMISILFTLGYAILGYFIEYEKIIIFVLIGQLWLIAALFFHFFEERVKETKSNERWMRTDTK